MGCSALTKSKGLMRMDLSDMTKGMPLLVLRPKGTGITVYWNESRLFHVYEGDKEIEVFTSMEAIEDPLEAVDYAYNWWHEYGKHYTQRTV